MSDFINIIIILCYCLSTITYIVYLFSQKDFLQKTGYYILLGGFVFHTLFIIQGYFKSGHILAHNLKETLSIAAWAITFVFLSLRFIKIHLKILGVYAAPLSACLYLLSVNFAKITPQPVESYKGFWLIIHVVFIFIGEASLALACGVGILYLIQEHALKTKKRGFFFKRLPSLELLDSTGYSCIMIGFSGFTIGLVAGLINSKLVWHHFANWDPKEIWSGISWLIYAALLHERIAVGWRGRRAAIMAIIGFAALLFTFIGVNFFMEGHHVNFTRWQS